MNDELIFGHEWSDIQRAQQGGPLHKTIIPCSDQIKPRPGFIALLEKHGIDGLKSQGLHGVIDNLTQAGIIKVDHD